MIVKHWIIKLQTTIILFISMCWCVLATFTIRGISIGISPIYIILSIIIFTTINYKIDKHKYQKNEKI